jgi:hypothetical protein
VRPAQGGPAVPQAGRQPRLLHVHALSRAERGRGQHGAEEPVGGDIVEVCRGGFDAGAAALPLALHNPGAARGDQTGQSDCTQSHEQFWTNLFLQDHSEAVIVVRWTHCKFYEMFQKVMSSETSAGGRATSKEKDLANEALAQFR